MYVTPKGSEGARASATPGQRAADTTGAPAYRVGGPCTYAREPGVATVTAIEAPGPGENNCTNDPKRVSVRFEATGVNAPARTFTLTIGAGANLPSACLTPEGITVGAKFPANLARIESGTCTPALLEFAKDFARCTAACF
jgi:hypothetical protein